ncbi:MAG: tRNA (adenosine(37)-N6)-threonylcarbamoyltransferase complex ATPase subunit type 1 TsaE [Candidatus Omnitrophica bacterium]|nr:tRNA (adenosine(37)-N6)-threonylcarbamoyltransferase complex ATPase subunit type 1 TsaE [Candidatus Omnitrophota bacterium]
MKIRRLTTRSPEETLLFGAKIGRKLKPGDVLLLEGDLGAGKTTFVKGVARGLGLRDVSAVKSPTFVIMHIYETKPPLYHFDLYRIASNSDLDVFGFQDFLNDPQAVACVEWAERAGQDLPVSCYRFSFRMTKGNLREIVWSSPP